MIKCLQKIIEFLKNYRLIKTLLFLLEFGVHLAEITIDTTGLLAIRQLASVLLKQYVEAHWSQHSDKFRSPETIDAVC